VSDLQPRGLTRTSLLARPGVLAVVRGQSDDPELLEPFVIVGADGGVMAFNGHVDLGTGIRTALAQIVAEELDVAFSAVTMILGDTALTPDQGPTIASETIQITAAPLRRAAAQARHTLVARAAHRLGVAAETLAVENGVVEGIGYAELVGNDTTWLALDEATPVKRVAEHRLVGTSVPRVDLPAKAAGSLVYVHDLRLPGMLHGRVVRPPYAGVDVGSFVGNSLMSVDRESVAHLPGLVAVVVESDFVGIVAEREEQAEAAMRALKVEWRPTPRLPDLDDLAGALSAHPSTPRVLLDRGDVDGGLARAAKRLTRRYVWPYQLHASIGPSCGVADAREGRLRVWSGTQNPLRLRDDLCLLTGLSQSDVEVIRMEAAGCYGRNGADDVSADAALLARAVGAPVRVQLTRAQEHLWEPKGAAQLVDIEGGLDALGGVAAYKLDTRYPSNNATNLALLLTGRVAPTPQVAQMGDRTAIGPYEYDNKRIVCHDMAPIVRASWFRGVSSLPNTFAHECWIDEAASEAGADPVEYRLRYLEDPRGRELVKTLAAKVGWEAGPAPHKRRDEHGRLIGRGFAYALYVHSTFPGYGAAWAAWVADVAVDTQTGEVTLSRVSVAQDSGLMINPEGVRHQIHGNVVQSTSRVLKEEVTFTDIAVQSRDWGGYPLLTFPELPAIDVTLTPPPDDAALGVGESASVPSAAAIANAIFDATGVRFREPPFTPERVLRGLREAGLAQPPAALAPPPPVRARLWDKFKPAAYAAFGAVASLAIFTTPWRPALAPIARPDASIYSQATLDKGRVLAELGGCVHCHSAEGVRLSGGRAIETPFGRLWSTNLTPDVATGIGAWSFEAFRRALREGVSRDGHRLYPAFPFTSFAKASDDDLTAIYAYLMAQTPAEAPNRAPELRFPYSLRPLNALWSALYHDARPFAADANQTAQWNRGAYLVEGVGHCSACHSPRDILGGEIASARYSGGFVNGWEAPALMGTPVPWTEDDLFAYLRTGFSPRHGAAGGSMAPIVVALKGLPDADLRAMAHYLVSRDPASETDAAQAVATREARAAAASPSAREQSPAGARLYEGACAVCHEQGAGPPTFGVRPSLAVASALTSARPDNLIRTILEGAHSALSRDLGAMPAFAEAFDDSQIAALAQYLRARFASEAAPWQGLSSDAARIRAALASEPGGY
jgi:nicotinate dehydrogenase subunit B